MGGACRRLAPFVAIDRLVRNGRAPFAAEVVGGRGDGRVGRARAVPSSAERPLAADASRSACPGSIGCRGRSGRCGTYGIRRRFLRRSSRGRARLWRRGPYDRSCRCLSPVCRQPFRMASSSRRALGCIPRRFSSSSSVRIIRFNSPRKSAVSPARRFLTNGT